MARYSTEAKECFVRHKDGYDVPVIKNARLAKDTQGHILGIVETITDLTELSLAKKREEDARRQLQEAFGLGNIIGRSPAMQNVFEAIGHDPPVRIVHDGVCLVVRALFCHV